jgi:hypothetical protein
MTCRRCDFTGGKVVINASTKSMAWMVRTRLSFRIEGPLFRMPARIPSVEVPSAYLCCSRSAPGISASRLRASDLRVPIRASARAPRIRRLVRRHGSAGTPQHMADDEYFSHPHRGDTVMGSLPIPPSRNSADNPRQCSRTGLPTPSARRGRSLALFPSPLELASGCGCTSPA